MVLGTAATDKKGGGSMGQEIYPESLKTIIRRNIKRRKRETIIDWSLLALAALIIAYKCGVF